MWPRSITIGTQKFRGSDEYLLTYEFICSIFRASGIEVQEREALDCEHRRLLCADVEGHRVGFILEHKGATDWPALVKGQKFETSFFCHGTDCDCVPEVRLFPFSTITFGFNFFGFPLDWQLYERMAGEIRYGARHRNIINCQNFRVPSYANRQLLYRKCAELGLQADFSITSPDVLFRKINDCFVAVFARGGGTSERIMLQFMAFGCCVISPRLEQSFALETPVPGTHYLECRLDFEDLAELLETPRQTMVEIGTAAKDFFRRTLTPEVITSYFFQLVLEGRCPGEVSIPGS